MGRLPRFFFMRLPTIFQQPQGVTGNIDAVAALATATLFAVPTSESQQQGVPLGAELGEKAASVAGNGYRLVHVWRLKLKICVAKIMEYRIWAPTLSQRLSS